MNRKTIIVLSLLAIASIASMYLIRNSQGNNTVDDTRKLCERGQTGHVSGSTGLLDCYRWRNDYLMIEEDKVRGEISEMQQSLDALLYERNHTRELIDMVKCDKLQHNVYCLGK